MISSLSVAGNQTSTLSPSQSSMCLPEAYTPPPFLPMQRCIELQPEEEESWNSHANKVQAFQTQSVSTQSLRCSVCLEEGQHLSSVTGLYNFQVATQVQSTLTESNISQWVQTEWENLNCGCWFEYLLWGGKMIMGLILQWLNRVSIRFQNLKHTPHQFRCSELIRSDTTDVAAEQC